MSEHSGEYASQATMAGRVRLCAQLTGTARDLARKTEIPRSTLGTYMSGRAAMTVDRAARIAEASGVSLRWLISGEGSMQGNERLIPVTGTTATGPGGRVAEWVPAESTDRDAYALHVATTDLSPRYMVGEVLVLHPNAAPTPGEEVMVLTTEGALMVCTLISALNGMVVVAPINSQYDQTTLPYSAIRMLHPVAASYRRSTIVRGGKPVST